jgi:hypothetical protein
MDQFRAQGQPPYNINSGDIRSHEDFSAWSPRAYQGRCPVIVQSMPASVMIRLKVASPGMAEGIMALAAKKR